MTNNPIILCSDQQESLALLSKKMTKRYSNISVCQLPQLEHLLQHNPDAILLVSWRQPCAELNLIVEIAEQKGFPLLVIVRRFNTLDISRLKETAGYLLLPADANIELDAWLMLAKKMRDQQLCARQELTQLEHKLAERKQIEKAKGLLMRCHQIDEESAFKALRSSAMQRSQSMGQIARNIITTLEVTG